MVKIDKNPPAVELRTKWNHFPAHKQRNKGNLKVMRQLHIVLHTVGTSVLRNGTNTQST